MTIIIIDKKEVRRWMLERDIDTFEELAGRAGISPTTLYKMLDGANFKNTTLDAIAKALRVHPYDILKTDGHPDPHMGAPVAEAAGT